MYLTLKASAPGLNLRLLLLPSYLEKSNSADSAERLERELSAARIVIYTVKDIHIFTSAKGMNIVRRFDDGSRLCLKLTVDAADLCKNEITVDDREGGRIAAETLIRGGSRCPAYPLISDLSRNNDSIAGLYHAGFLEGCRSHGITPLEISIKTTRDCPMFLDFRNKLWREYERGTCDGVFLSLLDEYAEFVLEDFFRNGLVPDRFRILSLNSFGHALTHRPPLTALSDGIEEVIEALLQRISQFGKCGSNEPFQIKIRPSILYNGTIFPREEEIANTNKENKKTSYNIRTTKLEDETVFGRRLP